VGAVCGIPPGRGIRRRPGREGRWGEFGETGFSQVGAVGAVEERARVDLPASSCNYWKQLFGYRGEAMTTMSKAVTPEIDPDVEKAQEYAAKLLLLSEGSVNRHFDPFTDIDWDNPDFAATAGEDRWILPVSADPLGRHPWYKALPKERQIEIGKYRQANIAKVGLQFESILISGMVIHNLGLPNGSPEFRYCSHEMIEEHNHTLMFQEMVNRIGVDVPGMGPLVRKFKYLAAPVAALAPNLFFMAVLAGEEPIDHIQKQILRSGEEVHPIMLGVMSIHVAEEARHISFAHE